MWTNIYFFVCHSLNSQVNEQIPVCLHVFHSFTLVQVRRFPHDLVFQNDCNLFLSLWTPPAADNPTDDIIRCIFMLSKRGVCYLNCGGQRFTVVYRFFTSSGVFGRIEVGLSLANDWQMSNQLLLLNR